MVHFAAGVQPPRGVAAGLWMQQVGLMGWVGRVIRTVGWVLGFLGILGQYFYGRS